MPSQIKPSECLEGATCPNPPHLVGTIRDPSPNAPVAGSLHRHREAWNEIGANRTILSWIECGIRIETYKTPPQHHEPPRPLQSQDMVFVSETIKEWLEKGVILASTSVPLITSRLGVVPKKNGKKRLIIDMRFINGYIQAPKFQYEDLRVVLSYLEPGDWMTTMDLVDGFHHVMVNPDSQQLLGFQWEENFYMFRVLPFGMCLSPYAFTKSLRPVVETLRNKGIRIVAYMDDLIVMGRSREECAQHTHETINLLQMLGWFISREKSSLDPGQQKTYLGYLLDTTEKEVVVKVALEKKKTVAKEVRRLLRKAEKGPVPARDLARIAGLCLSLSKAVTPTKVLLRNVYATLRKKENWSSSVHLSEPAKQDLLWWVECLKTWDGQAKPKPLADFIMETDASNTGWGAAVDNQKVMGQWDKAEENLHINAKELIAVFKGLHFFRNLLQERTVLVRSDNITTVAYLNNMSGHVITLAKIARAILNLAWSHNITLRAVHIPGLQNTTADGLSRLKDNYDWGLALPLFHRIDRRFGPHTVDRFAAENNRLLPRFNSRWPTPGSEAVDAFSVPWKGEMNFVNCPFRLIGKVLEKVEKDQCEATVIAPVWKAQPWFNKLLKLNKEPPLLIPNTAKSFTRGASGIVEPLKNLRWRLAAWRISGAKTWTDGQ